MFITTEAVLKNASSIKKYTYKCPLGHLTEPLNIPINKYYIRLGIECCSSCRSMLCLTCDRDEICTDCRHLLSLRI